MYKIPRQIKTSIATNKSVEGETIEITIERLLNNGDEIIEGKELIYTRPEDGIIAAFNIRHDHWDDAYEQASIMAEKRTELDAATLQKRKDILKKKAEEDKYIREQAKKGMTEGQNDQNGEV